MNLRHCKSRMGYVSDWSKHDTAIAKERASVESFQEQIKDVYAKIADPVSYWDDFWDEKCEILWHGLQEEVNDEYFGDFIRPNNKFSFALNELIGNPEQLELKG